MGDGKVASNSRQVGNIFENADLALRRERFMSRRDSPMVARHEVPGLEFGYLQKVMWSCGQEIFAPKGLEASAQGFNPGNRPRATRPEGAADRRY
jgi:hypothetical protein